MSKSQFLVFSATGITISVTAYLIYKKMLAMENENRELNTELYLYMEEEKCLKIRVEQLEKQIENLMLDKEKLFHLIEKTIDNKPSITHEEVHQITWSNNKINSSLIDSNMIGEAEERTLDLKAENEELTVKLRSVRTILKRHLLVDFDERKHRLHNGNTTVAYYQGISYQGRPKSPALLQMTL